MDIRTRQELGVMRERHHRLRPELYRGSVRCTFTICTLKESTSLAGDEAADAIRRALSSLVDAGAVQVTAYVIMSDHMHVILTGVKPDADLLKAVKTFKQLTARAFSLGGIGIVWQEGSFDHIHRKDEDLERHLLYLVCNPVRKGLVKDWREWPHVGGMPIPLERYLPGTSNPN